MTFLLDTSLCNYVHKLPILLIVIPSYLAFTYLQLVDDFSALKKPDLGLCVIHDVIIIFTHCQKCPSSFRCIHISAMYLFLNLKYTLIHAKLTKLITLFGKTNVRIVIQIENIIAWLEMYRSFGKSQFQYTLFHFVCIFLP